MDFLFKDEVFIVMICAVSRENQSAWAELCNSLWPHRLAEYFNDNRENANHFQNAFLYYVQGEAVAFINLSLRNDYVEGTSSSPVGYLEGIYVKPEHRNRGIGRKMTEFAKKWAAEKGCVEFASDCEVENEESRKFHNRIGFSEASTVVHFVMKL